MFKLFFSFQAFELLQTFQLSYTFSALFETRGSEEGGEEEKEKISWKYLQTQLISFSY